MTKEKTTEKKSIYLLFGEDNYSSYQKLKNWKNMFIQKYGEDANIEEYEGKKLNLKNFITNLETVPFLSDKRLIIVNDFFKFCKKDDQQLIAKSLDRTPDFCVIIFHENGNADKRIALYKKIKKIGTVEEFTPLAPAAITNWILQEAKKNNTNIDFKTANYLTGHAGTDLWKIAKELEKLNMFAQGEKITEETINQLVTPSLSASIFKLTDAISEKNIARSIQILRDLKDSGEDLIKVFFMIVRHFRILIQIHDMIAHNETSKSIQKRLGCHPFVVQKTSSQSRNFNHTKLKEIYKNLLTIDRKMKTGGIKSYQGDDREFQLAIEKLIINCC